MSEPDKSTALSELDLVFERTKLAREREDIERERALFEREKAVLEKEKVQLLLDKEHERSEIVRLREVLHGIADALERGLGKDTRFQSVLKVLKKSRESFS